MRIDPPSPALPPLDAERTLRGEPAPELVEAAQDFESLLLHQLVKAMRATVPREGVFGSSSEIRLYEQMQDQELARSMARGGGLGLTPLLVRQLGAGTEGAADLRRSLAGAEEAGMRLRVQDSALLDPSPGDAER